MLAAPLKKVVIRGDGSGGVRDGEAVDSSSCVNKVSGT